MKFRDKKNWQTGTNSVTDDLILRRWDILGDKNCGCPVDILMDEKLTGLIVNI